MEERLDRRGLSGNALKWIAVVTMLIDHIGAALLVEAFYARHGWGAGFFASRDGYLCLRIIGRLAFPIYCFLIGEGFRHTRSRGKYLLRLFLFALLSEVPFDLAFEGVAFDWSHQNVFFTLSLGLAALMALDWWWKRERLSPVLRYPLGFLCALCCVVAAEFFQTDYGAMGVVLILVLSLLRDKALLRDLLAIVTLAAMLLFGSSWIEILGGFSLVLIHLYNGQRGRQSKYFFYLFYPCHLLLLAAIRALCF